MLSKLRQPGAMVETRSSLASHGSAATNNNNSNTTTTSSTASSTSNTSTDSHNHHHHSSTHNSNNSLISTTLRGRASSGRNSAMSADSASDEHDANNNNKNPDTITSSKPSSSVEALATVSSATSLDHKHSHHNHNHQHSNHHHHHAHHHAEPNNNSSNMSNKNGAGLQLKKASQNELMAIVEVSRKRRLSRDSADSLNRFIRLAFEDSGGKLDMRASGRGSSKRNQDDNNNIGDDHGQDDTGLIDEDGQVAASSAIDDGDIVEDGELDNGAVAMEADELDDTLDSDDGARGLKRHHGHLLRIAAKHPASLAAQQSAPMSSTSSNNNNTWHVHDRMGSLLSAASALSHAAAANGLAPHDSPSPSDLGALVANKRARLGTATSTTSQLAASSPALTEALQATNVKLPFGLGAGQATGASRKSYLGNVVDRLHLQQQQQQREAAAAAVALQQQQHKQQQQQHQQQQQLAEAADEPQSGLSYHLQQFLAQQTSLEDLCSSVGLDDSNHLVLAAAIHRALVDASVDPSSTSGGAAGSSGKSGQDAKSSASSIGSSVGGSSAGSLGLHHHSSRVAQSSANLSHAMGAQLAASGRGGAPSSANHHHHHAPSSTTQRAYNTRAASGTAAALGGSLGANNNNTSNSNTQSRTQQQQRHAQAAAALSALAAGAHQHQHAQQASGVGGGLLSTATGASAMASSNGLVDFECDTCGSSFDDRHRLMQHQSIHLELKKAWFTETPVDEVMKIFNRRRGEFLCNTCNLRFEATFDYDKHNHQVHGQRPYCCQFCGNGTRTFRFWRQYLNHLYDHRYIFSCTIEDCDFTVNRRDSLRFHIFRFHLNCQLPHSQLVPMRMGTTSQLGGAGALAAMSATDSKWPMLDGDGHDELAGLDDDDLE